MVAFEPDARGQDKWSSPIVSQQVWPDIVLLPEEGSHRGAVVTSGFSERGVKGALPICL
jgi:hypothetical protein